MRSSVRFQTLRGRGYRRQSRTGLLGIVLLVLAALPPLAVGETSGRLPESSPLQGDVGVASPIRANAGVALAEPWILTWEPEKTRPVDMEQFTVQGGTAVVEYYHRVVAPATGAFGLAFPLESEETETFEAFRLTLAPLAARQELALAGAGEPLGQIEFGP